jgi:hypothetical protein
LAFAPYLFNILSLPLLLHINLDPIYFEHLSKYPHLQILQEFKERENA